jgi:hypothetical protein
MNVETEQTSLIRDTERARTLMRSVIQQIYIERFFCPNMAYGIIYGLFLIISSILNIQSKPLMAWIVWDFIRGSNSISGMILHCRICEPHGRINNGIRRLSIWFYVLVYIAGFPLVSMAAIQYGITQLPYVCTLVLITTSIDTAWLCYLWTRSRTEILLVPECNSRHRIKDDCVEFFPAGMENAEQCIVCLENYATNELLMKLHCRHIYHRDCILPWLKTKGNCPLCRDIGSVDD